MREILFKAKRKDNGEWMEGTVFSPESGIAVEQYLKPEETK